MRLSNRGKWGRSGGLARSHASPYGVARARARARPVVINYFNLCASISMLASDERSEEDGDSMEEDDQETSPSKTARNAEAPTLAEPTKALQTRPKRSSGTGEHEYAAPPEAPSQPPVQPHPRVSCRSPPGDTDNQRGARPHTQETGGRSNSNKYM